MESAYLIALLCFPCRAHIRSTYTTVTLDSVNHPFHFFFIYLQQHVVECAIRLEDQSNLEAATFPLKILTGFLI